METNAGLGDSRVRFVDCALWSIVNVAMVSWLLRKSNIRWTELVLCRNCDVYISSRASTRTVVSSDTSDNLATIRSKMLRSCRLVTEEILRDYG